MKPSSPRRSFDNDNDSLPYSEAIRGAVGLKRLLGDLTLPLGGNIHLSRLELETLDECWIKQETTLGTKTFRVQEFVLQ